MRGRIKESYMRYAAAVHPAGNSISTVTQEGFILVDKKSHSYLVQEDETIPEVMSRVATPKEEKITARRDQQEDLNRCLLLLSYCLAVEI